MLKNLLNELLDSTQLDHIHVELDDGWQNDGVTDRPVQLPAGGLCARTVASFTSNQVRLLTQCLIIPLSIHHPQAAEAIAGDLPHLHAAGLSVTNDNSGFSAWQLAGKPAASAYLPLSRLPS